MELVSIGTFNEKTIKASLTIEKDIQVQQIDGVIETK